MSAEQYGSDLLQQYETMIANIAEWRTNIYNILDLAQWKKQQSPRMQNDIYIIQNALMDPQNADIYEFAAEQVNIMFGYKTILEQLVESHRQLLNGYSNILSKDLLVDLEQKTMTLLTYFNYSHVSYNNECVPLVMLQQQQVFSQSQSDDSYSQNMSPSSDAAQTQIQSLTHIESNEEPSNYNGKSSITTIHFADEKTYKHSISNNTSWNSINSIGQSETIIDVE